MDNEHTAEKARRLSSTRPRIAIFDYEVTENSPSGSCHLRLVEGLCDEYEFTVFASAFDDPTAGRVRWVRVPAIRRLLAARFLSYYPASAVVLARERRSRGPFDLVQAVENYTPRCDISYVHFCHRAYLQRTASRPGGLRGTASLLNHRLRAVNERGSVRRARLLVAPSENLADELMEQYQADPERLRVIPNPVDVDRLQSPIGFDRKTLRTSLAIGEDDLVVAFVALGHFERKGLPALLEGLQLTADPRLRLLVVGGDDDLVGVYQKRAGRLGLAEQVRFVGMQADVRPYLWASDAFALPSSYEVFSLAPLQAAAAGLPLLVTPLRGVAPFFVDGVHGFATEQQGPAIASVLRRLSLTPAHARLEMGRQAREASKQYGVDRFVSAWRYLYAEVLGAGASSAVWPEASAVRSKKSGVPAARRAAKPSRS
jgi:glycosyltransferase involved in cell wall biosynthesis